MHGIRQGEFVIDDGADDYTMKLSASGTMLSSDAVERNASYVLRCVFNEQFRYIREVSNQLREEQLDQNGGECEWVDDWFYGIAEDENCIYDWKRYTKSSSTNTAPYFGVYSGHLAQKSAELQDTIGNNYK